MFQAINKQSLVSIFSIKSLWLVLIDLVRAHSASQRVRAKVFRNILWCHRFMIFYDITDEIGKISNAIDNQLIKEQIGSFSTPPGPFDSSWAVLIIVHCFPQIQSRKKDKNDQLLKKRFLPHNKRIRLKVCVS